MESIKNIYKIGNGPSSSHTMGPQKAALIFKNKYPKATSYQVTLYGSLALTGKGHLTDEVIRNTLGKNKTNILFDLNKVFKYHPNALKFIGYKDDEILGEWLVFSVGGGELKEENAPRTDILDTIYQEKTMNEILKYCKKFNLTLLEYIDKHENCNEYLTKMFEQIKLSVNNGLNNFGILPGKTKVKRKAKDFYNKYLETKNPKTYAYSIALAVSEENAAGGVIVTTPTCGSAGVLPAVLMYAKEIDKKEDYEIINALKIAGLIGLLAKNNASISGAEVGCQGEIGVACSMAAAAYAYLLGGSNEQIEYAAEIGLEHHLGLTCDPVNGEVQIPCIERCAISQDKAFSAAHYALLTDGTHYITFDKVLQTMKKTGIDLSTKYKETSTGGLATTEE